MFQLRLCSNYLLERMAEKSIIQTTVYATHSVIIGFIAIVLVKLSKSQQFLLNSFCLAIIAATIATIQLTVKAKRVED